MTEDKTTTPDTEIKEANPEEVADVTVEATEEAGAAKVKKRKVKKRVQSGRFYVQATFNNTIITVTDSKGNSLAASSAGATGFRGSKKGTAYAAQIACEAVASKVKQDNGMTKADVFVNGIGLGRDSAVKAVLNSGIQVESVTDTTGVPHGGCRPRKARRN